MEKRLVSCLIFIILSVPLLAGSWQQVRPASPDTIRLSVDSLRHLLRIKDSLLLQNTLDSLFLASRVHILEKEKDSLTQTYRELLLQMHTDSVNRNRAARTAMEFNRDARWSLRDSIYLIDKDSLRRSIGRLLDEVFDDSTRTRSPERLRFSMFQLMNHLANDSIYLKFLNARQDTIPFVLKKGKVDSVAFFVMNSRLDSAKIFMRSLNKNTVYIWVGDDLMLTQLLKRTASPEMIRPHHKELDQITIQKKKVPQYPPQLWDLGSEFNLLVSQVAFSHWAKGGNSSIAFTSDIKTRANFKKGHIRWYNTFQYTQGIQKQELQTFRKSQDRIEIKSSFNHKAFQNYEYSLGVGILTQTFKGYAYPNDSIPVSKFMAPGIFTLNLGMEYRPEKNLKLKFSPAASKFTAVLDTVMINKKRYGLKPGQRIRPELGAQFYGEYKTVLFKNVNMFTQLTLFSNYMYHPEKIDVDWRMTLDLKVNKYLTTRIKTHLIYDDDILLPLYEVQDGRKVKVGEGKRIQFLESLAVGFKFYL